MFVFILKNAVSLFLNTSKNLSYVISKNSRPYSSYSFNLPVRVRPLSQLRGAKICTLFGSAMLF